MVYTRTGQIRPRLVLRGSTARAAQRGRNGPRNLTMVYRTMTLPDIPDNLLILMGISGGMYLGFSYPPPASPPAGHS